MRRATPLFWRLLAVNGLVLVAACVITVVALVPQGAGGVAPDEAAILGGALLVMLGLDVVLLRRALGPLERLTRLLRDVDPLRTGQRVEVPAARSEAGELAAAYNDMLDRLEAERRDSARRALMAQERERLRVAQDLHDQVGQTLTAVLLQISGLARRMPDERVAAEVREVGEVARSTLEDVRRIARELRPEALDDLGLGSALRALCARLGEPAELRIACRVPDELPELGEEAELVLYRIAQEALTNVVRHAEATSAELTLERAGDRVTLHVRDDGRGLPADGADGGGIRGMRERAALVGAQLRIESLPPRGTEVRLDVPLQAEGLWYR